jgi:hypothetical protein
MEVATPLGVLRQVDPLLAPLPQEPLHFVAAVGEGDGLVRRLCGDWFLGDYGGRLVFLDSLG